MRFGKDPSGGNWASVREEVGGERWVVETTCRNDGGFSVSMLPNVARGERWARLSRGDRWEVRDERFVFLGYLAHMGEVPL